MDEMLELFKGQLSYSDLFIGLTYREANYIRGVRIERLKKEREEIEKERKAMESRQRRESILK